MPRSTKKNNFWIKHSRGFQIQAIVSQVALECVNKGEKCWLPPLPLGTLACSDSIIRNLPQILNKTSLKKKKNSEPLEKKIEVKNKNRILTS